MGDLPNRQKRFLLALTYGRSTEKCQRNVHYFRGSRGFRPSLGGEERVEGTNIETGAS